MLAITRDRRNLMYRVGSTESQTTASEEALKIGILVVAYNAASTLHKVLDRIPQDFRPQIAEVLILDDASPDATYLVALGYQQQNGGLSLTVVRHPENLGYGGNQKEGYRYAIDHSWDVVVLLHGDGQYAPELLPEMVRPITDGDADAVFGSRMLDDGRARQGGMPMYKFVGNRILSRFQNAVSGMSLSEWHSGYRAYRVRALMDVPFERNSDGFNFDTQIILQLHDAGRKISEIPIPTYYGDEICYVNGLQYARDITIDTLRYRLGKAGFGSGELGSIDDGYAMKPSPDSSHGRILSWMSARSPSRVLDLGCSYGWVAGELRAWGHEVTGVDLVELDGIRDRTDRFVPADLEHGVPDEVADGYDTIIAADVIEHVRDPDRLLREMASRLSARGSVLLSVPNFGHWYPRSRVALGVFGYDQRGILDATHLRFFTRKTLRRAVERCDLRIVREEYTGLPLADPAGGLKGFLWRVLRALDQLAVNLRPQLFGYQILLELVPVDRDPIVAETAQTSHD